jgi:transposase InsO family protein
MDMGRYLVEAHLSEGRSVAELAAEHGVHRSWIYKLLARYRQEGEAGLVPRSKAPKHSPGQISDLFEDDIVRIRKQLLDGGFDAGAVTIHSHLSRRWSNPPSVSTIWRVLSARGFVKPQPHKRPRSSYVRFVAELPNEMWQTDVTHVYLGDGRQVEILNFIDDHSRVCIASKVFTITTSRDVVRTFTKAASTWGLPTSVLSDNGAIFTASYRNGLAAMESEMLSLGIEFKHSRPYHPQTCGKVERFHQTVKKFLEKQDQAMSTRQLQGQLNRFVKYYNEVRPHRGINRRTPLEAFEARTRAQPRRAGIDTDGYRVRHDKVDDAGSVTLRYQSRLHHIGVGRRFARQRVTLLVAGRDIRILDETNQFIRRLTLDPTRDYQRHVG